ncbi:MAG: tetratricopeptide repeat protein [Bacteroidia bacterium]|nr:tetratricopeptide repeat protein [Bacteroidia bacterium]
MRPSNIFCIALLLFLCSIQPLFGAGFDPVYQAKGSGRCATANALYEQPGFIKTVKGTEIAELLRFAADKGDKCLQLSALTFWARYLDLDDSNDIDSVINAYGRALQFAKEHDFDVEASVLEFELGMKYYEKKDFPRTFELLLEAYDQFKIIGFEKVPNVQTYLYEIGRVHFEFSDYEQALFYLKLSLNYPFESYRSVIHTYNTLGLVYMQTGRLDLSLDYYRKAMYVARASRDSVWIGIVSGNTANVYMKQNRVREAKPLILLDYAQSLRYREWNSAASSLLLIVRINMDDDSLQVAEERLNMVEKLIRGEARSMYVSRDYFYYKSRLAYLKGNYKTAYELQDSVRVYDRRITREKNQEVVRNSEIKVKTEKYLNEIQLLESNRKRDQTFRNFVISIAISIIIIALMLLNSQRLRRKKDQALYQLEKQRAGEELKSAEAQLQAYMHSLLEKNRLIERLREENEHTETKEIISAEKEQVIEKLYEFTILTEDDWINFKRMFDKVHKDFFIRLKEKYPDLTLAETRLIALTKLNLSVNEIANMLGISPDSVRKTANRLRKKLNLPSGNDVFNLAADI